MGVLLVTMPNERRYAVNMTRQFLLDLLDPKKTPRVPSSVRKEAGRCLRHYPGEYYMEKAREEAPSVFGEWNSGWPELDLEVESDASECDQAHYNRG